MAKLSNVAYENLHKRTRNVMLNAYFVACIGFMTTAEQSNAKKSSVSCSAITDKQHYFWQTAE
jgi:hypothetical protein